MSIPCGAYSWIFTFQFLPKNSTDLINYPDPNIMYGNSWVLMYKHWFESSADLY